jgi:shikimate kinase
MTKTCVFIIGTNCVGKTTLAKTLIKLHGGVAEVRDDVTYLRDGRFSIVGRYRDESKYGGLDGINRTDTLKDICKTALLTSDCVFCEGRYLGTFGLNPMQALFVAERQFIVYLYCNVKELLNRNLQRTGYQANTGGVIRNMVDKQRIMLNSACKYASIGVTVLSFDTSLHTSEAIAERIIKELEL